MLENIAFVGGIHGVGKSTICKDICEKLGINYLSASEVLKWGKLNTDEKNKKVDDISLTQNLLIIGLNKLIEKGKYYILDGHYCLLNKEGSIERIPFETFQKIKPNSLYIITAEIFEIKRNLEFRDNREYNSELLEEMQEAEISYAKIISEKLEKKLHINTNNDFNKILESFRNNL
jgi:adenylate kinase